MTRRRGDEVNTRMPLMNIERVDEIIDAHHADPGSIIQVLLEIQHENHWIPKHALERIAGRLQVPMSRVQHIATFYKAFSLVPKGRHELHVCNGTSCHVRGAERVLESIEAATGIKPGETDVDMRFSLETVNCVGCCAHGPVVIVDAKCHGAMDPEKAREALKACD
jgi:NADH-quinone oxidoreductase subunit E